MSEQHTSTPREDMWSGFRERLYNGQRCVALPGGRTCAKAGWKHYNVLAVSFLAEDGSVLRQESIPAGRFNSSARTTGRVLRYQAAGRWEPAE